METGRNDRFCGSNGGADIGVFGMMSSVILTVQLIINIINARNNWQWGIFYVLCIFISVTTTTITTIITTMIISEQSLSPFHLDISVLLFCFSNNNLNDNSMVTINAPAPMNVNIAVPGGRSGRGVSDDGDGDNGDNGDNGDDDDGDECSADPEVARRLASCLRRLQCPRELETKLEYQYRLSLQAEIRTFLFNIGARGDDLDLKAFDYCSVDVFDVCSPLL